MFGWKRSRTEDERSLSAQATLESGGGLASGESAGADPDAVDAFVTVLRTLGQTAFDIEHENAISFSQQCEAWARHLLVLMPPPTREASGAPSASYEDEPLPIAVAERDWPSVLGFVRSRRMREQQHVNKELGDLRQGIWAFAQVLGTALVEDQRTDTELKQQIDRLKGAVQKSSAEELKQEMMTAADGLSRIVTERQQAQRQRLEELGSRVSDLAGQLREAKQENVRDQLTQLVNRRGFDEFTSRMVFMRDVFTESASMLMIDVDHFKSVNDTYGHPGGDAVLQALADCLVRNFPRKSDVVARYGGEELAAVLPDTSQQNAKRLAERVRQAVGQLQIPYRDKNIQVTISIGVAQLGRKESVQSWLERADEALYRAKTGGRNRVEEAISAD